jgi:hypothetical protein
MPALNHEHADAQVTLYQDRIIELENELKNLRESSFLAIRDLEDRQEKEKLELKDKYNKELEDLSRKYDKMLEEKIQKTKINEERRYSKENMTNLESARKNWQEEEKRRFQKFQTELVHAKSVEFAEREAYWKNELSRAVSLSETNSNRGGFGKRQKKKDFEEKKKSRRFFGACAILLIISIGAVVYFLDNNQKSKLIESIRVHLPPQSVSLLSKLHAYFPKLELIGQQTQSGGAPEVTVTTSANMREGPDLSSPVIRVIKGGTGIHVLEVKDGWSLVATGDTKVKSGWIHNSLLRSSK